MQLLKLQQHKWKLEQKLAESKNAIYKQQQPPLYPSEVPVHFILHSICYLTAALAVVSCFSARDAEEHAVFHDATIGHAAQRVLQQRRRPRFRSDEERRVKDANCQGSQKRVAIRVERFFSPAIDVGTQ